LSDDLFDKGMAARKAVLGADYVARAEANKSHFDADFQRYVTENAWGAVWARPGLEKNIRSMLTIAMLAALGRHEELGAHIRSLCRRAGGEQRVYYCQTNLRRD
jgi:4-carboxymuconolactone decarboxylase/3-oxoadipate enol-lactonase/4-carboxymuconolactone decarboxylase